MYDMYDRYVYIIKRIDVIYGNHLIISHFIAINIELQTKFIILFVQNLIEMILLVYYLIKKP